MVLRRYVYLPRCSRPPTSSRLQEIPEHHLSAFSDTRYLPLRGVPNFSTRLKCYDATLLERPHIEPTGW